LSGLNQAFACSARPNVVHSPRALSGIGAAKRRQARAFFVRFSTNR
jgi:hypothetical protein